MVALDARRGQVPDGCAGSAAERARRARARSRRGRGRLLQLFPDYWTYAFSQEWPEVEARLALARTEAELQLRAAGSARSSRAARGGRGSPNGGITVTPTIPAEIDVDVHEDGRMPVVISLFSSPWVITRIMPAAGLVLPAPGAGRRPRHGAEHRARAGARRDRRPDAPDPAPPRGDRPRSTRELAQLLELSEAAVSKHLHRLADAQLVRGERQGYYVLYRLIPERAVAASEALLAFLRVPSDSPAG